MNKTTNRNIKLRAIGLTVMVALCLLSLPSAHFAKNTSAFSFQSSFEGTWKGTAGDPRVDERWTVTYQDGKWDVVGYYYWTKQGHTEDSSRKVGRLAGSFEASNVRMENGVLKFTQTFDQKPISSWADTTRIEATVDGDTVTFKNEYVSGVKLKRT
jgi:hypothetical protein